MIWIFVGSIVILLISSVVVLRRQSQKIMDDLDTQLNGITDYESEKLQSLSLEYNSVEEMAQQVNRTILRLKSVTHDFESIAHIERLLDTKYLFLTPVKLSKVKSRKEIRKQQVENTYNSSIPPLLRGFEIFIQNIDTELMSMITCIGDQLDDGVIAFEKNVNEITNQINYYHSKLKSFNNKIREIFELMSYKDKDNFSDKMHVFLKTIEAKRISLRYHWGKVIQDYISLKTDQLDDKFQMYEKITNELLETPMKFESYIDIINDKTAWQFFQKLKKQLDLNQTEFIPLFKRSNQLIKLQNEIKVFKDTKPVLGAIENFDNSVETWIGQFQVLSKHELNQYTSNFTSMINKIQEVSHDLINHKFSHNKLEKLQVKLQSQINLRTEKFNQLMSSFNVFQTIILPKITEDNMTTLMELQHLNGVSYQKGINEASDHIFGYSIGELEEELVNLDNELTGKQKELLLFSIIVKDNALNYRVLTRYAINQLMVEHAQLEKPLIDLMFEIRPENSEPIPYYFVYRQESDVSKQQSLVRKLIQYYRNNSTDYPPEFVVNMFMEFFDEYEEINRKFSYNILNLATSYAEGEPYFNEILLLQIDFLFDLGRFEEAIDIIEAISLEDLTDPHLRDKYVIFKSNLYDAQGDHNRAISIVKDAIRQYGDLKNDLHQELLRLKVKYHLWNDLLQIEEALNPEIEHRFEIAKELANQHLFNSTSGELDDGKIEKQLELIGHLIQVEQQELVPNLTKQLQYKLLERTSLKNTKIWNFLGFTYYYEGIAYEFLLDEVNKLMDSYQMAEYCFERAQNELLLTELRVKKLEFKQLNVISMQSQISKNTDLLKDPGALIETMVNSSKLEQFKEREVKPLISQIVTFKQEGTTDMELQQVQHMIKNDYDAWQSAIQKKFQMFFYVSKYDKYRLYDLLRGLQISIGDVTEHAVDIVITLLRRLRPGREQEFFNFTSIVTEIRRTRLSNTILGMISRHQLLEKFFTMKSAYSQSFSNLSLIEATSLLFILTIPFLAHPDKPVKEVSMNYKDYLHELTENFVYEEIITFFEQASFALKLCIIETADILNVFGGLVNE